MPHSNDRCVTLALMDRVPGAGQSGAKQAPGFRANPLQPRPPINPLVTEHDSRHAMLSIFSTIRARRMGLRACRDFFSPPSLLTDPDKPDGVAQFPEHDSQDV
jgi:hypothetical protein